eukprot:TRINITY_DN12311_c0_g1_i1.p1 TRINITY_DN12311_c0_g1~~TRINITY_DN12311_c0_g1_i1.p1  ORF type:complete len:258 (-),score=32.82 TRINITY_DN12311_c0_g1_i1:262-1035(-)
MTTEVTRVTTWFVLMLTLFSVAKGVLDVELRVCPEGFTRCCGTEQNNSCCPFADAICCPDDKHCCPRHYRCHDGKCFSNNGPPYKLPAVNHQALGEIQSEEWIPLSSGWELLLESEFCLNQFLLGFGTKTKHVFAGLRNKETLIGLLRGLFLSIHRPNDLSLEEDMEFGIRFYMRAIAKVCRVKPKKAYKRNRILLSEFSALRWPYRFHRLLANFLELSNTRRFQAAGQAFQSLVAMAYIERRAGREQRKASAYQPL